MCNSVHFPTCAVRRVHEDSMSTINNEKTTTFDTVMEILERIPFAVFQVFGFLWVMRVYNTPPSRRVAVEQGAAGIMLTGIFVTEKTYWTQLFAFSMSPVTAEVLGLVMALLISCLDRLIFVSTLEKSFRSVMGMAVRVVLLGIGMWLTAMPLQISFNHDKIEIALEKEQKDNIDANFKAALAKTEAVFDEQIEESKRLLGAKGNETATVASADVATYIEQRAKARERLLESQSKKRQTLTKDYELKSRLVRDEAGGRDEYGNEVARGLGSTYQAKKVQEEAAHKALLAFEDRALKDQQAFDDETDKKSRDLQDSRDKKVTTERDDLIAKIGSLRKQKEYKVDELRLMSPDEIIAQFGGSYKVSRDALGRYAMLEKLQQEDRNIWWMCRKLEIIIGFFAVIIILIKLFGMSPESKLYFDLRYHVKLKDPEAIMQASALGHTDMDRFALPLSVIAMHDKVYEARQDLCEVLAEFEVKCRELSASSSSPDAIRDALREFWQKRGRPAMKTLDRKEYALRSRGYDVDPWPTLLGADPRSNTMPWNLSDEELGKDYGWRGAVRRPVPLHTA